MFAWRGNFTNSLGGDPYWNAVVFAQNFEYPTPLSTSLATAVADTSTTAATVTIVNGPPVSYPNFTPFTGVGSSVRFGAGAANGYLTLPTNTLKYNISSGVNFTLECWAYPLSTPNGGALIAAFYPGGPGIALGFGSGGNGSTLFFGYYTGSWNLVNCTSPATLTLNVWSHIAAVRVGSTVTIYINGTSAGSGALGGAYTANNGLVIGRRWDVAGTVSYFDGYMSNVRFVNGTAVYTTTFTPPTAPLTAITNTVLLQTFTATAGGLALVGNGTLAGTDLSTNAFTPTGSGTFSGLSPFTNTYPGSFNFVSASLQSLVVATNAVFTYATGDFTMECWVRFNTVGTQQFIIDQRNSATATAIIPTIYLDSTNVIIYYVNGAVRITGTQPIVANTWYHVAVARSSTSTKLFVNGTQDGSTYSDSNSYAASRVVVGTNAASAANYLNGYATNVRLVKGTAVYTANFTPSSIPLTAIANTSLLLVNNAGFQDISPQGQLISTGTGYPNLVNNIFKYGIQSSFYVASAQQIIPNQTYLPFGTNSFTIEMWVYRSAAGATHTLMAKGGTSTGWVLQINSSNQLIWISGTSTLRTSTTTIGATTWTHVAITRSGTTGYMFVGGALQGASFTDATNYNQLNNLSVGTDRIGTNGLSGYLDDIRVTNGIARYTATYTPMTSTFPTYGGGDFPVPSTPPVIPAFVTTGITLYVDAGSPTSYSGTGSTWTDLSGNGYSGTITAATFTSLGVSSYFNFNGTTARVNFGNVAALNFGTGDFTISFWWSPTLWANSYGPLGKRTSDGSTGWFFYRDGGFGTKLNARFGNVTNNVSTTVVTTSTWSMYTYIRSGSGAGNVKLYINGSATADATYTNTTTITDTASFYIGYTQNYNQYYPGRVALAAIYTRALTTAENTQNYDATSYRY
jgi:hypothetical protein